MENENKTEVRNLLKILPPVEFCCVYGSTLHPNNHDKSSMVDYILGVSNPLQWHSENLKMNRDHYASWMVHLGGARLVTDVADEIGVGVHFNPFVTWNDKMYKYGVVRMNDLTRDILRWERFYLSGRFQKPVRIIVDNVEIENLNSVNLRAATSAALLLLPSKFTEEELYARICSLSYMGDLRMLFAEDKNKVKKIVRGQFDLFKTMYKPFLDEYATKELLRFSSSGDHQVNISQDCGLSAASSLVSYLPPTVRSEMGMKLGEKKKLNETGTSFKLKQNDSIGKTSLKHGSLFQSSNNMLPNYMNSGSQPPSRVIREVVICSREEAAECMRKILRRKVMVSSARQAVAGLLTVGAVHGVRYLANKMHRAWKSWT